MFFPRYILSFHPCGWHEGMAARDVAVRVVKCEMMRNDALVKNIIAKALGALWIFDGLLQLQPAMFGHGFVSNILTPLLSGEPAFLHAIIAFGIQMWNTNTIAANSVAALFQIGIGVLLLFPLADTRFKVGAYVSIVWGLLVWLFGEGAGLLFTGAASLYAGAPGAVIFYIVLAALLLLPQEVSAKLYSKVTAWTLLFGAALQIQPIFWTAAGAQQVAMTSTMEAVPALSALPAYLANIITAHAICSNIILIALPFSLGIALLLRPNRITGTLTLIFLFLIWWIGQDFGQLSSIFYNTPTDPQLSPLLALLLLPLFITVDVTNANRRKFETIFMLLCLFAAIFVLSIIMYGAVVITLQNSPHTSAPSTVPIQMHMSG